MQPRWGSNFASPHGYIAQIGLNTYAHCFGGQEWKITDPNSVFGGPTLLLTLDLDDARLSNISINGLRSLPLCSYINSSVFQEKQIYQIDPKNNHVTLLQKGTIEPELFLDENELPNPLPRKAIYLRDMLSDEYPTDKNTYYEAFENFLGGDAFIRISGPPLWITPTVVDCDCGSPMKYIASIGYENESQGFLDNMSFFIGECALFFYLCSTCLKIAVLADGT